MLRSWENKTKQQKHDSLRFINIYFILSSLQGTIATLKFESNTCMLGPLHDLIP